MEAILGESGTAQSKVVQDPTRKDREAPPQEAHRDFQRCQSQKVELGEDHSLSCPNVV